MPPDSSIDFEKIIAQSQTWLESKEFNEKYIKTNHPYPPFLNPEVLKDENATFNYKNIPADFAWESNLPLPEGYKFLFVMMSHSGHSSMVDYLQKCGVRIMKDHYGIIKEHYKFNYDSLLKKESTVINFTSYSTMPRNYLEDLNKYIYLINPQTRVLCLVRDPIPRLKSSLNNHLGKDWVNQNQQYYFKENDNLRGLENRVLYSIDPNKSFKDRVEISLTEANSFRYSDIYEKMLSLGFQQFDFLDIQKITRAPDIFNLMKKLSQTYDLPAPKSEKDFDFLLDIRAYYGFLPLLYEVRGIHFLFTTSRKKQRNVVADLPWIERVLYNHGLEFLLTPNVENTEVSEILNLNLSWFEQFGEKIYIYIKKENLPNIYQNMEFVQQKINIFIDKLKTVMEIENILRQTTEKKLLDFFQTHPRHCQLFQKVIRKEVEFVRKIRPDIVATWHYYLEFEKICKISGEI